MIEPDSSNDSLKSEAPAEAAAKATAGSLLRAAREAQGLHIAALATAIKVTPRKVDALENDRLHELPDATFARALAQTICRYLKVDSQPVMALMPPSGAVALEPASRIQSTPYRDRSGRSEPGVSKGLGPLLWGAALLLVGAVVVYLLPASWLDWGASRSAALAPASAPTGTVVTSLPLVLPAVSSPGPAAAAASSTTAGAPSVVASAVLATASPASAGGGPVLDAQAERRPVAETVFAAPPPSAGTAPVVSGALVVSTTDASWVEVRDAKGRLLLGETVQPGRSVGLDGPLPMRLLIGNAAATQLVFMGRPVDVMARSRENVARFELQ